MLVRLFTVIVCFVAIKAEAACNPAILADALAADRRYAVLLGDAEVSVNGRSVSPETMPNAQAMELGPGVIAVGPDGTLTLQIADGMLRGSGPLVDAPAWEWEAEAGVFPPDPNWALQTLGCLEGALPRWKVDALAGPGIEIEIELTLSDPSLLFGQMVSRSGDDNMRFEMTRTITFLQE